MPEQYVASDRRTGVEVAVTGEFPPHPDDRVRIARTTQLFTRLMSTILSTDGDTERRERFVAIETQLELAEALIRGDVPEVQRLMRTTLERMGITREQMDDLARKIVEQMGDDLPPDWLQRLEDELGSAPPASPTEPDLPPPVELRPQADLVPPADSSLNPDLPPQPDLAPPAEAPPPPDTPDTPDRPPGDQGEP